MSRDKNYRECAADVAETTTVTPNVKKSVEVFHRMRFIKFDLTFDGNVYTGSNKKILGYDSTETTSESGLIVNVANGSLEANFDGIKCVIAEDYLNFSGTIVLINIHNFARVLVDDLLMHTGFKKFNFHTPWAWGSSDSNLIASNIQCTNIKMGR